MTQTAFDITSARSKNIDLIILLTTVVDAKAAVAVLISLT